MLSFVGGVGVGILLKWAWDKGYLMRFKDWVKDWFSKEPKEPSA